MLHCLLESTVEEELHTRAHLHWLTAHWHFQGEKGLFPFSFRGSTDNWLHCSWAVGRQEIHWRALLVASWRWERQSEAEEGAEDKRYSFPIRGHTAPKPVGYHLPTGHPVVSFSLDEDSIVNRQSPLNHQLGTTASTRVCVCVITPWSIKQYGRPNMYTTLVTMDCSFFS